MRSAWRVRALGFGVAFAAAPTLVLVEEPLGGILASALAVVGLFIAIVVAEAAVPASAVQAIIRGNSGTLSDVARGLSLAGRPIYVPDQGNVGAERLFLPAGENEKRVPVLDADTVAYSGAAGTKAGLAVTPAGLDLVDEHAAATGVQLRGATPADVESFLKGLGARNDLMRSLRLTAEGESVRVRFMAGAARPPCMDGGLEPLCERTGCALCQAVGCSLARNLGRPVLVDEARVETPWVELRLRAAEELA